MIESTLFYCGALPALAWKEASKREKAISRSRPECFHDEALLSQTLTWLCDYIKGRRRLDLSFAQLFCDWLNSTSRRFWTAGPQLKRPLPHQTYPRTLTRSHSCTSVCSTLVMFLPFCSQSSSDVGIWGLSILRTPWPWPPVFLSMSSDNQLLTLRGFQFRMLVKSSCLVVYLTSMWENGRIQKYPFVSWWRLVRK